MADIQFDEEMQHQHPVLVDQKPFFVRLILSTKIVSTDKHAEYVLVGFVILSIVIIASFISLPTGKKTYPVKDYFQDSSSTNFPP
jgi:hypothetical protein